MWKYLGSHYSGHHIMSHNIFADVGDQDITFLGDHYSTTFLLPTVVSSECINKQILDILDLFFTPPAFSSLCLISLSS